VIENENKHSTDIHSPHPPPHICVSIHSECESFSDLGRVLVLDDPPDRFLTFQNLEGVPSGLTPPAAGLTAGFFTAGLTPPPPPAGLNVGCGLTPGAYAGPGDLTTGLTPAPVSFQDSLLVDGDNAVEYGSAGLAFGDDHAAGGGIENKHSTDIMSPLPPLCIPRVRMSIPIQGKPCGLLRSRLERLLPMTLHGVY